MKNMMVLTLMVFAVLTIAKIVNADGSCCDTSDCPNFVCQPCNNATECPECFPNGPNKPPYVESCCTQLSHVIALTAASVQASVFTFAAAEACARAATKVVVSASATASVSAFVSVCQSVSLSLNTGNCCEISADVQANASAYAQACAQAAAEANAAAEATASAQAAAKASASAAASLFALAESIIKSSCCGFHLDIYSVVTAAGKFAIDAQSAAEASVQVSAVAVDTANACAKAAAVASAGTSSIVSAKIDNCCVSSHTKSIAYATASECQNICDKSLE